MKLMFVAVLALVLSGCSQYLDHNAPLRGTHWEHQADSVNPQTGKVKYRWVNRVNQ